MGEDELDLSYMEWEDTGDPEDEGEWTEHAGFVGPCTCDHPSEEHGWGSCGLDDCPCEAGWEE